MPIPFTASQIKAWLETGDHPTQQQFADWVDTLFYMNQQALDLATAADAAAAAAVAAVAARPGPKVLVALKNVAGTWTVAKQFGCTAVVSGFEILTVTFSTAFADTNYALLYSYSSSSGSSHPLITRNVGSFVMNLSGLTGSQSMDFALWP